jgi:hypothetical protein
MTVCVNWQMSAAGSAPYRLADLLAEQGDVLGLRQLVDTTADKHATQTPFNASSTY